MTAAGVVEPRRPWSPALPLPVPVYVPVVRIGVASRSAQHRDRGTTGEAQLLPDFELDDLVQRPGAAADAGRVTNDPMIGGPLLLGVLWTLAQVVRGIRSVTLTIRREKSEKNSGNGVSLR